MTILTEEEAILLHRYICEGVGDPKRLRLLYLVAEQPRNVSELTEMLGVSQPTVSHHLRILRDRGLVEARKEGTTVYYFLSNPRILEALDMMRAIVAQFLAEGAQVLGNG
ncbi:MAG TPA: metalloregulator ArsR/SmtB family transcription factor [Anaerolineae bacterium]|nr:MAG: HTH-type transcriptional repressor CzrA [Chloroflexi bacterium ADurb.Bin222]HOC20516.1 metalloregulator ArsR/SmtB family transcription factor [Anaerolineae bacterium]HQM13244.1 metalloregulator ArsR/SmtB family transcription factor [Anaerolineae bacterium]